MPSRFSPPPTAEQVIQAVDAVVINHTSTNAQFVANFADLTQDQAESALLLAEDLGFLKRNSTSGYEVASPLCRFVATQNQLQRATALRVLLESYSPFLVFRQRLTVTDSASNAACQTKAVEHLTEHHGDVSATLLSLGTYSQALSTGGGGQYRVRNDVSDNDLELLLEGCGQVAAAEERIREQIGPDAERLVSREHVIGPLADALRRAHERDPRGAVTPAGNAIESYLLELAGRLGVNLTGKHGINAKVDAVAQAQRGKMPSKLTNMSKYLGHLKNAADHGIDSEVGAQWTISDSTGIEYVFVACSFIAAVTSLESGSPPQI